jgi:muramoyltetrapeptide carboxypeptidase
MVEPDFSRRNIPLTLRSLDALVVSGTTFERTIPGRFLWGGKIEGRLTGGNLTLVTFSLGTPVEIETKGKVLFLEEVNEEPYRVDRMLTQLKFAGKLDGVKGIVFGEMINCKPRQRRSSFSLREVLTHFAREVRIPCFATFPSGHGRENVVLPMGGWISLGAKEKGRARFRLWY